jgi:hypothetical protein
LLSDRGISLFSRTDENMAVSAFACGSRQDENGDGRLGPLEETVTRIAARIGYFHRTIATLVDHFVAA